MLRVSRVAGMLAVAAGLVVSACGGSSSGTGDVLPVAPAPSATSTMAEKVPDMIKADGKLLVGTSASYPPNESIDPASPQVVGWDVELGQAVAAKLGMVAEFHNAWFDTIIPGVQSGKFEMGISSLTANPEREKSVDFVTYFSAGTAWAAPKGNPKGVYPDTACGRTIGVSHGTVQFDDLQERSRTCVVYGKPPINMVELKQQTQVNADLRSGKIDAMLADSPIVGYVVKQGDDKFEVVGRTYDSAPYGYAIAKSSTGMKEAVQGVLRELIADGTYQRILAKWGVQNGEITSPAINPHTSE